MTAVNFESVWERFDKLKAIKYLEDGKVVVFVGWTGNPYFTTDTGWVLRALEIEADMIIKATKVDWLYDKDPAKNPDAKIYDKVTYSEVLEKNLKVMDQTAIALARDENMSLKIVNLMKKWALKRAILGEKEGTVVCI
jgi:uridylate kinase